jgi:hypothetical protein
MQEIRARIEDQETVVRPIFALLIESNLDIFSWQTRAVQV